MRAEKFKVLILTDHSRHSKENSIYSISAQMLDHPLCSFIDIASRGIESNEGFFKHMNPESLHATKIDPSFKYDQAGNAFTKALFKVDVNNYDILLLRLPRPLDDAFLYWLERISIRPVIINDPNGIIKTSNKAFLINFPSLCPPMKMCYSIKDIQEFAAPYPIVLKPLKEYGGRGILKIDGDSLDDGNSTYNTTKYLLRINDTVSKEGFLAMKFLKNVTKGDKRIIVVSGEAMASSLRFPATDSWLCNVAQGGSSVVSKIDEDEKKIIEKLNPIMLKAGIFIYGIDTLEDDSGRRMLSEINTLSIGGFPQAEQQMGLPIIKWTIEKIFEYAINEYDWGNQANLKI